MRNENERIASNPTPSELARAAAGQLRVDEGTIASPEPSAGAMRAAEEIMEWGPSHRDNVAWLAQVIEQESGLGEAKAALKAAIAELEVERSKPFTGTPVVRGIDMGLVRLRSVLARIVGREG
jgi:hypothetical protein